MQTVAYASGSTSGLPLLPHPVPHSSPLDLQSKIRSQIEYYFSVENLNKDVFIRRKMDAEGFLPISLIASFHRVQHLTQDVAIIITSLKDSLTVELSEDGIKARPRQDPLKWPLNFEVDSLASSLSSSSLTKSNSPPSSSQSKSSVTHDEDVLSDTNHLSDAAEAKAEKTALE